MRKVVIYVLILTICIGYLSGTTKSISALQDDIEITPEHIYGDPKVVEGKTVEVLTTLGNHVWWETDYTAGGETETQFHFSQEDRLTDEGTNRISQFDFYGESGGGMSTSGGEGFTFKDDGMGRLVQAVADKTQPGQTRSEELLVSDYLDCYPMTYVVHIVNSEYYIENYHDNISSFRQADNPSGEKEYNTWMELFRFPLEPGQKMEISLTKDADGAVREINYNMIENPSIGFTFHVAAEGMYFSPIFQSWEGEPITTGEYVYGYGLYYIPFRPDNEAEVTVANREYGTFDFENLELVYPLENTDELIAIQPSPDESQLYMLTLEDGMYCYSVLDLNTRQVIHHIEITTYDPFGCAWQFFPEQGLLVLKFDGRLALVNISGDPNVEFVIDWPEDVKNFLPDSVVYEDGVLYMTSPGWTEQGQVLYIAACDGAGLAYCGSCSSNLFRREVHASGNYISMDEVALIK